jgi:riboflavin kinase/FMN adenylyltransferase
MMTGVRRKALSPVPLDSLSPAMTGGVVAIGNFDGLHPGHVALLNAARAEAEHLGTTLQVLTFEPHPRTFFRPDAPVFRLSPLPVKARLLTAIGVDGIAVAHFDRAFAATPAEDFIDHVLYGGMAVAGAVVGFNFRFGRGRAGTPETLVKAGRRLGFTVRVIEEVAGTNGTRFSSSAVREALVEGDVLRANRGLGYRWFVVSIVVSGDRRGRTLGFPTPNLQLGAD